MRKAILVGAPANHALQAALYRELHDMTSRVRATLPALVSPSQVRALGAALKREWSDARIEKLLREFGTKGEAHGAKPWRKLSARTDAKKRPTPLDGSKLVDKWLKKSLATVTSVRDEVAPRLAKDLAAALEAGTSPAELHAKWLRDGIPVEWGTLDGRLKVIAQHQLATLHAETQRARAEAIGVSEFWWRNMGDDDVRERHLELGDTRWSYADPPADEGLPGTPINCRCWAESIVPDSLLANLKIEGILGG